jgi:hypothetical protein
MEELQRGIVGIAQTLRVVVLAVAIGCSGCHAVPADGPTTAQADRRFAIPPEWRPGDRWIYRSPNGSGTATRTIEVREIRDVKGVKYYVLTNPDDDLLNFWTLDLRWAGAVGARDSKVEARIDPPAPWFNWPLEPGRRWDHQAVYEDRGGKRAASDTFMVMGLEMIEVPAGRYQAMKIVREGQSGDSDQYWYVPEVRSYARWILKRSDKRVEEELVEYKPADRLIPRPATPTSSPR